MSGACRASRAVAVVVSASIALPPPMALALAQNGAQAKPAGVSAPAIDGGWPRAYTTASGGALLLFQPQVASWDGQHHMVAHAAVSYTAKSASKPALGTVKLEAETAVAVAERLVNFSQVTLTESHFSDLPAEQIRDVVAT